MGKMASVSSLIAMYVISSVREVNEFTSCKVDGNTTDLVKLVPFNFKRPPMTLLGKHLYGDCMCQEIESLHIACFGKSRCKNIPVGLHRSTLKLEVTDTNIQVLKPGDFDGLLWLQIVKIDNNLNLSKILPGTFKANLTQLYNISISYNPNLRDLHTLSFDGLVGLRYMYLIENGFQILNDITTSLSTRLVPNLIGLWLNGNTLVTVSKKDFFHMENSSLEELYLISCSLKYLDPDCLRPLRKLRTLQLGKNNFNSSVISDLIGKTVHFVVPLNSLMLRSVGFTKNLPERLLESIAKSRITELDLSENIFVNITSKLFPFVMDIQKLNLSYVQASEIHNDLFERLPKLKKLILIGNNLTTIPNIVCYTLLFLDLSKDIINRSYHLNFTNLSSNGENQLVSSHPYVGKLISLNNMTFYGVSSLEFLILKGTGIYHIQSYAFIYLRRLQLLNLENNYLHSNNSFSAIDAKAFWGLEYLEVLYLGGCGLTYLSKNKNPFKYLQSLYYLGLERNNLKTLSASVFSASSGLLKVELSDNSLSTWSENIFKNNSMLQVLVLKRNKIKLFSRAMLEDFSNILMVEAQGNPFSCNCHDFKVYREWFSQARPTRVDIMLECGFPEINKSYNIMDHFPPERKSVDNPQITLKIIRIVATVTVLFICLAIILVCYFYRWNIRYHIFLIGLNLRRNGYLKSDAREIAFTHYRYDAFVSYCSKDRDFVGTLVDKLERNEPFLKLCIYERDFEIGTMITESVLESVAQSRRIMLVISESFAKSQWCRWESQIAEHHRLLYKEENRKIIGNSLILILLGSVSGHHMPHTLKFLLKTRIYLQWEDDEIKKKLFWEKLKQALKSPKREEEIPLESARAEQLGGQT